MNNHRRSQRGANYYQEGRRAWPWTSQPSTLKRCSSLWASESRNQLPSVPSWEKKFCWEVGMVPWWKLLETKKYIDIYPKILKWDDSANEEAFRNAKARYWAKINDLSCDVPLPDPNAHIDEVDWNLSDINHELLLDYDREFVVDDTKKGEGVIIFGEEFLKSKGFSAFGWGDEEVNKTDQNEGWDASATWEGIKGNDGGENGLVGSGWNQWDTTLKNAGNQKEDGVNNQWECNKHGNQLNYQVYNQWETRNWNGRRSNFVHDQQACHPMNHRRPAKQGNTWGWEKSGPVSGRHRRPL